MELNDLTWERQLMVSLPRYILPAAYRVYKLSEEVLLFYELKNYWIGPFKFVQATGRMIKINSNGDSKRQTLNEF